MLRSVPFLALVLAVLTAPVAPAQQAKGKKYALLIGVKRYDHANLSPLYYTENDVARLAALLKPQGYEVTLLSDSQEEDRQPTKKNIETLLSAFVEGKVREDTVLFGFAGHGLQFEGDTSSYFLPREAKPSDRNTMVSLQKVYEKLADCGAGVRLMFVDACRNIEKGVPRNALSEADPPKGVCAIFSCSKGQSAWEDNDYKHGIFFYHLINGLCGEARNQGDADVTILGLAKYAMNKVRSTPGYKQDPVLKGEVSEGVLIHIGLGRDNLKFPDLPKRPMAYKEITNSIGMKLVYLTPGKFVMGTSAAEQAKLIKEGGDKSYIDAEGPEHEVEITEGFYIGKFLVTQAEYKEMMGNNPSKFSALGSGADKIAGLDTRRFPVEQISWHDAKKFCELLSAKEGKYYSLPTEAEWEYACRADTVTRYSLGDVLAEKSAHFLLEKNSLRRTDSVDNYPPNPWGLYDVHGNVAQWCEDWFDITEYKRRGATCKDPMGPATGSWRVFRGGHWDSDSSCCRSACRHYAEPQHTDFTIGFRVIRRDTNKRIAKKD